MYIRRTVAQGFTLVEVMIVIAVIVLLLGILLPSLAVARERGRRILCVANLRTLAQMDAEYAHAYKDWVPRDCSRGTPSFIYLLTNLNRVVVTAGAPNGTGFEAQYYDSYFRMKKISLPM